MLFRSSIPIRIIETESTREARATPVVEFIPAKTPQERPDIWTMLLAGFAILIACAIVGLMIWRVGWNGDDAKPPATASEKRQSALPTQPAPAPQEEILEFNGPIGSPAPQGNAASTQNVAATSSTKTSVPPAEGLAIYDRGKLIYGTPIHDADDADTPKSVPVRSRVKATPVSLASASTKDRTTELSPDAADGLLANRVEPEYPDAARRAHIQGTVTVDTLVGADGKVLEANAVNGSPQLTDAAAAAVRQWRYKPHVVNGKKVAFRTQVPVTFMLPQ